MKWVVKLSEEGGHQARNVGVVSDAFTEYTTMWPKKSFFFQNGATYFDGERQGGFSLVDGKWQGDTTPPNAFFSSGDVVTVELERRHGQDGVMRVRVAGNAFVRDITGLPRDGTLYPAVCPINDKQSYTMIAAP